MLGLWLTFILLLIELDRSNPVSMPASEFLLASTEKKRKIRKVNFTRQEKRGYMSSFSQ